MPDFVTDADIIPFAEKGRLLRSEN